MKCHRGPAAVVLSLLFATALAHAQDECAARFKAADKNGDGLLTTTEMSNAGLPQDLGKTGLVTRSEFATSCAKTLPVQAEKSDKSAPPSPHSTGVSVAPETKGVQQPQGPTGPVDTKSGGAPAESPQGQTPPGMQSAPDGSSKSIVDPDAKAR